MSGWTICTDWGSDRPAYEADLLVCWHCGKTVFMCDSVTKNPLPASAVAERCTWCDKSICGGCKNKLNSGGVCSYFLDRIGADEEAYKETVRLGSWL